MVKSDEHLLSSYHSFARILKGKTGSGVKQPNIFLSLRSDSAQGLSKFHTLARPWKHAMRSVGTASENVANLKTCLQRAHVPPVEIGWDSNIWVYLSSGESNGKEYGQ